MKTNGMHCQSLSIGGGSTGKIRTSLKVLTPRTRRRINLEVMGFVQTDTTLPLLSETYRPSPRMLNSRRDLCGSCGAYWKRNSNKTRRELSSPVALKKDWRGTLGKSVIIKSHPLKLRIKKSARATPPVLLDEKSAPSPWSQEDEVKM